MVVILCQPAQTPCARGPYPDDRSLQGTRTAVGPALLRRKDTENPMWKHLLHLGATAAALAIMGAPAGAAPQ